MNRKLQLWLVLLVMGAAWSAQAQETLTVYDGTDQSNVVPAYLFYFDDFTRSQMVIPASDLDVMAGGTISAITFYTDQTAEYITPSTAEVYLMEVSYTEINAFEPKSNVLYTGTLTIAATGELTIQFTTPYTYGGGNLLIGIENTTDVGYRNVRFYGKTMGHACSFVGANSSSLDAIEGSVRNFIAKTTFTYTPGSGVIIPKPTNLTVSDITPNEANVSWTAGGDETSWDFEYKLKSAEEWTSTTVTTPAYALTDLRNGDTYEVRVRANVGGQTSVWVSTTFSTPTCGPEDMGEISYELNDSYGDGWGSNALEIYNSNGQLVASLTFATGYTASGTVALCWGETYTIKWKAGSYATECGFTVYDAGGEVIVTHTFGDPPTVGELATFLMRMPTCIKPQNLTATNVVYNGATLSWTPGNEEQDAWHIACGAKGFDPDADGTTYIAVSGEPTYTLEGLSENTAYDVYVRGNCGEGDVSAWSDVCTFTTPEQFATPTNLTVSDILARSAKANWEGEAEAYNLRYRVPAGKEVFYSQSFEGSAEGWTITDSDGDGNKWGMLHATEYSMGGVPLQAKDGEYVMISQSYVTAAITPDNWLISPQVDLKGTLEFYVSDDGNYKETYRVYVSTTGTAVEDFVAISEDMTTAGGGSVNLWEQKTFDLSEYNGQKGYIAIRHYNCTDQDYIFVDAFAINGADIPESDWTVLENVTSPAEMTGLSPNTLYEVQVQAVFEEGTSNWSDAVTFTTLAGDETPFDLTVTEVGVTTADVEWSGVQDTYNLRYRTAGFTAGYEEGFEYGLPSGEFPVESGWTTIDADGDGKAWYIFTPDNAVDNNGNPTVLDASCITSASYQGAPLTPDNWLVSPQLDLDGTLSFMVRGQDPTYPAEHYAVYVSTGSPVVNDFVELIPEAVSGISYQEITADLSAYAGQKGYIAIRHFNCSDEFRLNIDNFRIINEGESIEPGEWVTVEGVTSPYTIEGLEEETNYEVEVQGVLDDGTTQWTAPVPFTTLASVEATLAQILENGEDGETYSIVDELAMVAQTPDGTFTYVTDGNDNWAKIQDLPADLFDTSKALVNTMSMVSNLGLAPTLNLVAEPATEDIEPVAIETIDLATLDEMPALCKVAKVTAYYVDGMIFASEEASEGLLADTSFGANMVDGKLYELVVAFEQMAMPSISLNPGLSRNLKAVVLNATEVPVTGISNVNANKSGEIRYYDTMGRYVGKSLDNAPAGIYLGSDGRKVIK